MGRLEKESVQMEVYSDASFGNVEGGKSQIGYIIGLRDKSGERCPLAWKSRVGKRVAHSTIEDEAIGLGEVLEMAVFLQEIWRELSGEEVAVVGMIDSKTLERAIVSTTGISNRRLRIDLAAIKEALEVGEVAGIQWVESEKQVTDGLTKVGGREALLVEYILAAGEEEREG